MAAPGAAGIAPVTPTVLVSRPGGQSRSPYSRRHADHRATWLSAVAFAPPAQRRGGGRLPELRSGVPPARGNRSQRIGNRDGDGTARLRLEQPPASTPDDVVA